MVGGHKFYDRREIRDILAYLTLIVNPADSMSFERVVNTPKRGIGLTSVEHLRDFANNENGWTLLKAAQNVDTASEITARTRNKIDEFGQLMANLTKQAEYLTLTDLTEQILELSGYNKMLVMIEVLKHKLVVKTLMNLKSVTQEYDEQHKDDDDSNLQKLLTF